MRKDVELLHGAVDIHVHHAPDLYPRIQDHLETAESARLAGFRAVCLKSHNFPTVQMAAAAHKAVPEVDVFGSLVCNHHVGGINPIAVEAALKYGARQIYMPTVDSANHEHLVGFRGQHGKGLMVQGGLSKFATEQPRISLLDGEGRLRPEMNVILAMIADAGVILNFGHISFDEMVATIKAARKHRIRKLVVDHPFFSKLTVHQQQTLAEHGVYVNYTAGELLPRWWRVSITDFADAIRQIGPRRMILSSDCGQLHNPPEAEGMRMMTQLLIEEGFDDEDIRLMMHKNPADMIYDG